MFFKNELIKGINNAFANLDTVFRDIEKAHNSRGLFPTISIPSILHAFETGELVEMTDEAGVITFYKNGKVHREDGPAVVYERVHIDKDPLPDEYWLEGKQVTKKDVEDLAIKKEEEKVYSIYIGEKEYKIKGKKKLQEFEKLLK